MHAMRYVTTSYFSLCLSSEPLNFPQDGRALLDYAGSEDVDSENLRLGNITHYVMNVNRN